MKRAVGYLLQSGKRDGCKLLKSIKYDTHSKQIIIIATASDRKNKAHAALDTSASHMALSYQGCFARRRDVKLEA